MFRVKFLIIGSAFFVFVSLHPLPVKNVSRGFKKEVFGEGNDAIFPDGNKKGATCPVPALVQDMNTSTSYHAVNSSQDLKEEAAEEANDGGTCPVTTPVHDMNSSTSYHAANSSQDLKKEAAEEANEGGTCPVTTPVHDMNTSTSYHAANSSQDLKEEAAEEANDGGTCPVTTPVQAVGNGSPLQTTNSPVKSLKGKIYGTKLGDKKKLKTSVLKREPLSHRRRRQDAAAAETEPPQTTVRFVCGIGCGAVTVRYLTRRYIGEYSSNSDLMYRHDVTFDSVTTEVEILDTSKCQNTGCLYEHIRWGEAFVVVYSVCDRHSFNDAHEILEKLSKLKLPSYYNTLLLGNKRDLDHARQICVDDGQELSLQYGCQFYEVSAAENCAGVSLAFQSLLREARSVQLIRAMPVRRRLGVNSVSKVLGNIFGKNSNKDRKKRPSLSI